MGTAFVEWEAQTASGRKKSKEIEDKFMTQLQEKQVK